MLILNIESLHLLNYVFIALIILVFAIYVNHIRHHLLFELLLPFNELTYTWRRQNIYGFAGYETDTQTIFCEIFQSNLFVPKNTDNQG